MLVIAEIVEEWSAACIYLICRHCLCRAVTYEYQRSNGCTNKPQTNSSQGYPLHFVVLPKNLVLFVLSRIPICADARIREISQRGE